MAIFFCVKHKKAQVSQYLGTSHLKIGPADKMSFQIILRWPGGKVPSQCLHGVPVAEVSRAHLQQHYIVYFTIFPEFLHSGPLNNFTFFTISKFYMLDNCDNKILELLCSGLILNCLVWGGGRGMYHQPP